MNLSEFRAQFPQYDRVSDKELVLALHRKYYADRVPLTVFAKKVGFKGAFTQEDLGGPSEADQALYDPTKDIGKGQLALEGAGKAFADAWRGVKQIAGADVQKEIDQSRQLDKPLMSTGAGIAGNLLGNAALFAPTAMIPGVNTYTGAALAGAGLGALAPVATGESRLVNAAGGAAAGLAGQGAGRLLGRLIRPVQSQMPRADARMARAARAYGIPTRLSQQTGSRPLAVMESVMENLPFTSESERALAEAQQRAFTKAALSGAGIRATSATPELLAAQKTALGRGLEGIASQNVLDFGSGLGDDLTRIALNADTHLPPGDASKVAHVVRQIMSGIEPQGTRMPGTVYQGWREPLRQMAKKGDALGGVYQQIRRAMDEAFVSQLSGQEGIQFRHLSRQYQNLKQIIDAMAQAGAESKRGILSPAALEGAITKSIGREGKALGRGGLTNLVGVGRNIVSSRIPDSGTAQRMFMQRLLTGNVGGATLGAAAGAYGSDPEARGQGALLGGLAGASAGMIGPKVIQALIQSPIGRTYLTKGIKNLSQRELNLLSHTLRSIMLGTIPATTQIQ